MTYYYLAQLAKPNELGIPDQQLSSGSVALFLNGIYFIAGFMAVLMIIIGSIRYITSSGDSNKATKARNTIVYSAIGIAMVALAFSITSFVLGEASK